MSFELSLRRELLFLHRWRFNSSAFAQGQKLFENYYFSNLSLIANVIYLYVKVLLSFCF